jgi:hypothetical protein
MAGVAAIGHHGDRAVARPAHPLYGDVVRSSPPTPAPPATRSLADALERQVSVATTDAPGALAPRRRRHRRPGLCWRRPPRPPRLRRSTAERLARCMVRRPHVRGGARPRRRAVRTRRYVEQDSCSPAWPPPRRTSSVWSSRCPALGSFWGLADGEVAERILVEAEDAVTDPQWWSELRHTGDPGRPSVPSGGAGPARRCDGGHDERSLRLQAGLAEAFALPGVGRGERPGASTRRCRPARRSARS